MGKTTTTNVSMDRSSFRVPCERCGRPIHKGRPRPVRVCADCRESDPLFVQAVASGVRCV